VNHSGPDSRTHRDEVHALRVSVIRAILFYTEGAGMLTGDRYFWDQARSREMARNQHLFDAIRAKGGWQTERELQIPWEEV